MTSSVSSTEAIDSPGQATDTAGKSCGMTPREINASRHKYARPTLLEIYTSCFVVRGEPAESVVDTSTIMPPSTPISSEMAPRMESVTGKMSHRAIPIASAVRRGMMLLWQPVSAIIGISTGVGLVPVG